MLVYSLYVPDGPPGNPSSVEIAGAETTNDCLCLCLANIGVGALGVLLSMECFGSDQQEL